jgi:hypothetical protein
MSRFQRANWRYQAGPMHVSVDDDLEHELKAPIDLDGDAELRRAPAHKRS